MSYVYGNNRGARAARGFPQWVQKLDKAMVKNPVGVVIASLLGSFVCAGLFTTVCLSNGRRIYCVFPDTNTSKRTHPSHF